MFKPIMITSCFFLLSAGHSYTQPIQSNMVPPSQNEFNEFDQQQIKCLAKNIYFEAGNQSLTGKIAVANVVINRVKSKGFPETPCKVIYQKTGKTCQFSWVCQNKKIRDFNLYQESHRIAQFVYKTKQDITNGALFFHSIRSRPSWSYKFKMTARIGDHIFYRS